VSLAAARLVSSAVNPALAGCWLMAVFSLIWVFMGFERRIFGRGIHGSQAAMRRSPSAS
jgi:hypothetical protein